MDQDRIRGRGGGKPALELLPLLIQLDHPVFDLLRRNTCDNRVHQLLVIAFGPGEAAFQGLSRALGLGGDLARRGAHVAFMWKTSPWRVTGGRAGG